MSVRPHSHIESLLNTSTTMLNHGRVILTEGGYMLDEVKSLLQKALRRGERGHALWAVRELSTSVKHHYFITYLLEDHCYASNEELEKFIALNNTKSLVWSIDLTEQLLLVKRCRTAAMMPLVGLKHMKTFEAQEGNVWVGANHEEVDFNSFFIDPLCDWNFIFKRVKQAWEDGAADTLLGALSTLLMITENSKITISKLAEAIVDRYHGHVCDKPLKKYTVIRFILCLLCKWSIVPGLRRSLFFLYKLSLSSGYGESVGHDRLLLANAFCRRIDTSMLKDTVPAAISGEDKPIDIPSYAIDKHTHRGRTGKPVPDRDVCDKRYCALEKKSFNDFWRDGLIQTELRCVNLLVDDCYSMYMTESNDRCRKTAVILKKAYNQSRHASKTVDDKPKPVAVKRKQIDIDDVVVVKQAKVVDEVTDVAGDDVSISMPYLTGPLLRKPCGSAKTHTWYERGTNSVVKGPYRPEVMTRVLDAYEAMTALGEKDMIFPRYHESVPMALAFKNAGTEPTCENLPVTKVDYKDAILRKEVKNVPFINPDVLGVVSVHKLSQKQFKELDLVALVEMFLRRAVIGVGDSGLFNVISWISQESGKRVFTGIDYDEVRSLVQMRKQVGEKNELLKLIMSKLPANDKAMMMLEVLKTNKSYFVDKVESWVSKHSCVERERVNLVHTALLKL
uniref:ORF56 n=1 Tax=Malaco herpesvirus 1 TaxID=3031797 RepID=A0AA48P7X5_9VIRU|nr:TPA_asm: ORF56 [Malaco herpesvirus 1]